MEIDEPRFKRLKKEIKEYYASLDSIHCPYFGEEVLFRSDGLQHMFHKGALNKKPRSKSDQLIRMKLFKLAPKLLRDSKVVQEYQRKKAFIPVVHNNRSDTVLKTVEYWGFMGIVDDKRIKVVVKKVGNGILQYWSVVPKWRRTRGSEDIANYVRDLESY